MNKRSQLSRLLLCLLLYSYLISCDQTASKSMMGLKQDLDMDVSSLDLSNSTTDAAIDSLPDLTVTGSLDSTVENTTDPEIHVDVWDSASTFGSDAIDQALSLDLLPDHKVVIAGRTEGQLNDESSNEESSSRLADGFVALISASGELDWVTQIGSSAVDQFLDVIYHPQGIIIAGGLSTGDLPEQENALFVDGLIVALNTEGTIIWQTLINIGTINRLIATANGFIVVGSHEVDNGDYAAFVAKYDLDGEREWFKSLNSPSNDSATSVTLRQNRIFVSGFTSGSIVDSVERENVNMFVAALSSKGESLWLKEYGGEGDDSPIRIAHDQESLVIAGYTSGLLGAQHYGDRDVAILKLDFDGEIIWQKQFGTQGNEAAYSLSITPENNIFVGGRIDGASWNEQANLGGDAFVLKLTSTGEVVHAVQFHREGRDEIVDLMYKHDRLTLAGYAASSAQLETEQSDIFVHRINATEGFDQ